MRFPFCTTLFVFGLGTGLALAAPEFSFETTEHVPKNQRAVLEQALQFAMREVRENPPAKGNPLVSRVKRRVHVVLTSSHDPLAEQVFGISRDSAASDDSDAFTFTAATQAETSELITYIFVLADRIAWNPETGRQREDAYIRMLMALGHEVYGNLPHQLPLKLGHPPAPATLELRQEEETAAFTAGIAFMERYLTTETAKTQNQGLLAAALEREKATLATWANSPCPNQLDRAKKKKRTPKD